jgi:hypothetical protein
MTRFHLRFSFWPFMAVIHCALIRSAAAAPVVWSGPLDTTFSKSGTADPTLPQNQDRISENVWLTRGSLQGPFNIAIEAAYQPGVSPGDTEWATDVIPENDGLDISAANWQQLSFLPWAEAYGGPGPALIGNILNRTAVVHLISDDIYFELEFLSFQSGGTLSYRRMSAPIVPEPASALLLLSGLAALPTRRRGRVRRYARTGHLPSLRLMRRCHLPLALAACASALLAASSAQASFHEWFIKEIYSNYNGTVQFIELFTNSAGQQFLPGHDIRSNSTIFPFPTPSPAPTNGHHLLLATPGYVTVASAPGSGLPMPNYTFAANNFFSVTGDTITFAGGFDVNTFTSIPTDGITSLNYSSAASAATQMQNSPRNYLGTTTAFLNLPPPSGDYNGDHMVNSADYIVWRNTLGQTVTTAGQGADGDGDGRIDMDDFFYWKARFGNPAGAGAALPATSVPEPGGAALLIAGLALSTLGRRRHAN